MIYVCKQLGCLGILLCSLVRLKQFPLLLSLPPESISHSPKACSWLGESGRLKYNLFDEVVLLKEWFLKCGSYFSGRCRGLHEGATVWFSYSILLFSDLGKKGIYGVELRKSWSLGNKIKQRRDICFWSTGDKILLKLQKGSKVRCFRSYHWKLSSLFSKMQGRRSCNSVLPRFLRNLENYLPRFYNQHNGWVRSHRIVWVGRDL